MFSFTKNIILCIQLGENNSSLFLQMVHANINHTVSEENLNDKDYMLVDDLQKLTDEYIMEVNSSLTPKPIWRSFIESLFEGIVTLDLDKKDKILVGNLDYLKDTALIFAAYEEEALGISSVYILANY